ncbi:MAG: phage minor capsid protein [Saccharofermentans sp.]|nr:phage minor capsid protein [Saccharofermentans sp.]
MTPEDIGDIFQALEDALFAMAIRNMDAHKNWEDREGFMWTQWQAEQIKGLRQYREKCKILTYYHFNLANEAIEEFLQEAYEGSIDDAVDLAARAGRGLIRPGFFGVNSKKMDVLVEEAVKNIDNKRYAVLNRMNSGYVDFLRKADIFAQSGSMTIPQALDTAMKDFLSAGLNCVEYSNGNRVNIASYAEMALRTSSSEVTRQANGDVRNELDEYLVVSNVIGITCPICQKWQGKVMIDDVYADGKPDGEHPLVSESKADGFMHPNCRHQLFMYIEGVTEVAELPNDVETKEHYQAEQKQRYFEREIRKYKRLRDGAVDPSNRQKYDARVKEWTARHNQYLSEHDYLRKNPKRLAPGYTGNGKPEGVNMSAFRDDKSIEWPQRDKKDKITTDEFIKLRERASRSNVRLEGFRSFTGDVQTVNTSLDAADQVFELFPELKREPVILVCSNSMPADDFAMTDRFGKIHLNADAFRSQSALEDEYSVLADGGLFVKGTNSSAIICHELGHKFSMIHPEINCRAIAEKIMRRLSPDYKGDLMQYLAENLSNYSAGFEDGSEIISECFAGYFGGSNNEFALNYIRELVKMIAKGGD